MDRLKSKRTRERMFKMFSCKSTIFQFEMHGKYFNISYISLVIYIYILLIC